MTGSKDYLPVYKKTEVSEEGGQTYNNQAEKGQSSSRRSASLGGISGVSSVNVLTSSVSRQQVIAGQQANFNFSNPGCSVMGISFVSGISAGTVTGKVEILNGLPKTVLEVPKGEVYQYMNIVIGSQGFGESGSFEGAVIDFKVPRAWIEGNNINEAKIFLNRFHENAWVQLSTEKVGEDEEFLYLRSETHGFSFYSITGQKKGAVTITPTETSGSGEKAQNVMDDEAPEATSEEGNKIPGFGSVFTTAGVLSALRLLKKRSGR